MKVENKYATDISVNVVDRTCCYSMGDYILKTFLQVGQKIAQRLSIKDSLEEQLIKAKNGECKYNLPAIIN